jgi:hypothetical protein
MIFQLILTIALCAVLLYSYNQRRLSRTVNALTSIITIGGIYLTWLPSHATEIAELLGIGRGADLVLYLWVVISLGIILNLHLRFRATLEQLTQIVRYIAIRDAQEPEQKVK